MMIGDITYEITGNVRVRFHFPLMVVFLIIFPDGGSLEVISHFQCAVSLYDIFICRSEE